MNTLLASCMAAIFSFWVWWLKREIGRAQPLVTAGHEEPHPTVVNHLNTRHPISHVHTVGMRSSRPEEPAVMPSVRRNGDGVPVWKIDV